MTKNIIQIGQRFTRLEVISETITYNKRICRLCRCDCGNETYVREYVLISGGKRSCGCLKLDQKREFCKAKGVRSKYFPLFYLSDFRSNAKSRKIDWSITLEDLDIVYERQNGKCYYTGTTLTLPQSITGSANTQSENRKLFYASYNVSIDRIDNNRGYYPDNICLCLKKINICKNTLDKDDFIKLCQLVSNNFSELHFPQ